MSRPVSAWAIVGPWGGIASHLVRKRRAEAIDALCVGLGVSRSGGGWAHLYRRGWRCVRVTVAEALEPLGALGARPDDPQALVQAIRRKNQELRDRANEAYSQSTEGSAARAYASGQAMAFHELECVLLRWT